MRSPCSLYRFTWQALEPMVAWQLQAAGKKQSKITMRWKKATRVNNSARRGLQLQVAILSCGLRIASLMLPACLRLRAPELEHIDGQATVISQHPLF